MTRWARAGNSQRHQKIPSDATKWGEFDLQKGEGSAVKNKSITEMNSKSNGTNFSPRKNVNKIEQQKNKKMLSHIGMSYDGDQSESKMQNDALRSIAKNYGDISLIETENAERSHQKQNISAEKIQTKKRKRDKQNTSVQKTQRKKDKQNDMCSLNTETSTSKTFENYGDISQVETENVERSHQQQNISVEKIQTKKRKRDKQNTSVQKTQTKKRKKDKQNDMCSLNTETSTSKSFENKKSNYLEKLQKRRAKNGILLLPAKVERKLYNIKRRLREKNIPPALIVQIIRKERRKEELKFRKTIGPSKVCFNCRQSGHILADCPEKLGSSNQETGICFKCGSKEHTSFKCPEKVKGFLFAKCFICKEQGHISKDCPNNKHGVYPKGGRCNLCGNVNHLKKDCPTLKERVDSESTVTLQMIDGVSSIDAEVPEKTHLKRQNVKKTKIVKF